MSDSNHHANALVKDTTRKANAGNHRIRKLMLLIKVLVLAASLTLAVGYFSDRSRAQQGDDRSRGQNQKEYDQQISDNAQRMMDQGKQIFRYDTFGSEDFWRGIILFLSQLSYILLSRIQVYRHRSLTRQIQNDRIHQR